MVVAKGEGSAAGAATEAARRAAAAVAAEAVAGATADAASRTGSPAERGGETKIPNGEAERSSRNNVEMERI